MTRFNPLTYMRSDRRLAPPSRTTVAVILIAFSFFAALAIASSAGQTDSIWAAAHDLQSGQRVGAQDLKVAKVLLPGKSSQYFSNRISLVGKVLTRDVSNQELIPAGAITNSQSTSSTKNFPLHVLRNDMPFDLKIGNHVDLYAIPSTNISLSQNPTSGITSPMLIGKNIPIAGIDPKSKDLGGDIGLVLALNNDAILPLVIDISNTRVLVVKDAI